MEIDKQEQQPVPQQPAPQQAQPQMQTNVNDANVDNSNVDNSNVDDVSMETQQQTNDPQNQHQMEQQPQQQEQEQEQEKEKEEEEQEAQQQPQQEPQEEKQEEEEQEQEAQRQVQATESAQTQKETVEMTIDEITESKPSKTMEENNSNKMDVDNDNNNKTKILPELIECRHLLSEFMRRVETEPFNEPVDWKGLNLPDYPLIITKPMDLGTVMNKLTNNKYVNADLFASDIRLVFKNAKTYNTPGSGIYVVAENLHKQFERRFARITKNCVSSRKRKSMDKIKNQRQSTFEDRVKFTNLIQTLEPQELGIIVEIIDKKSPTALSDNNNNDELEIEVYHIDADTLKHLISHCEKLIKNRNKRSRKK